MEQRILITGAGGQLGSELALALAEKFGKKNILATDINPKSKEIFNFCNFEILDVTDIQSIENLVDKYEITQIYHLAALLSAVGERNPLFTWQINMQGLLNVLEVARKKNVI